MHPALRRSLTQPIGFPAAEQRGPTVVASKTSRHLEGQTEYLVYDPARPGEAITDIDHIEGDVLWEVKTAVDAVDRMTGKDGTARWIRDKVTGKADRYVRARAHIPGYEDADIGFRFMTPGADPAFQAAVNAEIARLRTVYPAITWLIEWR